MGAELDRVKDRKRSRALIEDLYLDANRVYVIHYSCESFYENDTGESKRVTSIATRNLKTGQTKSWSIHKEAELSKQLSSMQAELNKFEKSMLKGFFQWLDKHKDCRFLHWNMRDENFGFFALEHRFLVLGGKPVELPDDKKVDLARELVALYGRLTQAIVPKKFGLPLCWTELSYAVKTKVANCIDLRSQQNACFLRTIPS